MTVNEHDIVILNNNNVLKYQFINYTKLHFHVATVGSLRINYLTDKHIIYL